MGLFFPSLSLSPLLFLIILEVLFYHLQWNFGININERLLNCLRFVDNNMCWNSRRRACQMLVELFMALFCAEVGLKPNYIKTKNITNTEINIKGNEIEYLEEFVYLG